MRMTRTVAVSIHAVSPLFGVGVGSATVTRGTRSALATVIEAIREQDLRVMAQRLRSADGVYRSASLRTGSPRRCRIHATRADLANQSFDRRPSRAAIARARFWRTECATLLHYGAAAPCASA